MILQWSFPDVQCVSGGVGCQAEGASWLAVIFRRVRRSAASCRRAGGRFSANAFAPMTGISIARTSARTRVTRSTSRMWRRSSAPRDTRSGDDADVGRSFCHRCRAVVRALPCGDRVAAAGFETAVLKMKPSCGKPHLRPGQPGLCPIWNPPPADCSFDPRAAWHKDARNSFRFPRTGHDSSRQHQQAERPPDPVHRGVGGAPEGREGRARRARTAPARRRCSA